MTHIYSPDFTSGAIYTGITVHKSLFLFCHITVNSLSYTTTYEYAYYSGERCTLKNKTWEKLHDDTEINKTYTIFIETIENRIKTYNSLFVKFP